MTAYPPIIGLTLNYRDASRTLRCIQSLLDEGAAHVLVWDNSNDGGASAAALFQGLSGNSRVSVEISSTNLGFAAGVNRGIEWIKANFEQAWVLLLNNDARLLPGAIPCLAKTLVQHERAVIAYRNVDHAGHVLGTVYYQRHTGLLTARPIPGSFPYASGCCQLIAVERIPAPIFDEAFFMYGEDWAQGWELGESRMVHVAQTLVVHEGSASSNLGSEFYETLIATGHWILAQRISQSKFDKLILVAGRLLMLSSRAVLRCVRYHSSIPLKAFFDAWRFVRERSR